MLAVAVLLGAGGGSLLGFVTAPGDGAVRQLAPVEQPASSTTRRPHGRFAGVTSTTHARARAFPTTAGPRPATTTVPTSSTVRPTTTTAGPTTSTTAGSATTSGTTTTTTLGGTTTTSSGGPSSTTRTT